MDRFYEDICKHKKNVVSEIQDYSSKFTKHYTHQIDNLFPGFLTSLHFDVGLNYQTSPIISLFERKISNCSLDDSNKHHRSKQQQNQKSTKTHEEQCFYIDGKKGQQQQISTDVTRIKVVNRALPRISFITESIYENTKNLIFHAQFSYFAPKNLHQYATPLKKKAIDEGEFNSKLIKQNRQQ